MLQYIKSFSNFDQLKSFIAPNMTDIIKFLGNNVKLAIYVDVNIHAI